MTLNDLKLLVDFYINDGHGEDSVFITTSDPSIGARASVEVELFYPGFDWESGQMRLDPKYPLIRKELTKTVDL